MSAELKTGNKSSVDSSDWLDDYNNNNNKL